MLLSYDLRCIHNTIVQNNAYTIVNSDIHSKLHSKLHYCNSLLLNLSVARTNHLQLALMLSCSHHHQILNFIMLHLSWNLFIGSKLTKEFDANFFLLFTKHFILVTILIFVLMLVFNRCYMHLSLNCSTCSAHLTLNPSTVNSKL